MVFPDKWWGAKRVKRLLCLDCSSPVLWAEDPELILRCICELCREDIERLMSYYWAWVPKLYLRAERREREMQKALRQRMVIKSLLSCGCAGCAQDPVIRAFRPIHQCLECAHRLYMLSAGGDVRPIAKRYVRLKVERLLVSALVDPLVTPVLADIMEVDINEEVMAGCTLYTLAQEIGVSGGAEMRLSSDLADLLTAILGGGTADLRVLGFGSWILNGFVVKVRGSWRHLPDTAPGLPGWPRFPDDWRDLGERLSSTCSTKYKKRQRREQA